MTHALTVEQVQGCVAKLNKLMPRCQVIAAGGCLRDIICGKPIKDLDFFIDAGPADFFGEGWYDWFGREFHCGYHAQDGQLVGGMRNPGDSRLDSHASYGRCGRAEYQGDFFVAEYPVGWYGFPVQFVFIGSHDWVPDPKDPLLNMMAPVDVRQDCMTKFDFALSRIWCDARRLHWTPEFARDRHDKRLSYFGSGWGETSPERMQKMKDKFSDYRFVNRERP